MRQLSSCSDMRADTDKRTDTDTLIAILRPPTWDEVVIIIYYASTLQRWHVKRTGCYKACLAITAVCRSAAEVNRSHWHLMPRWRSCSLDTRGKCTRHKPGFDPGRTSHPLLRSISWRTGTGRENKVGASIGRYATATVYLFVRLSILLLLLLLRSSSLSVSLLTACPESPDRQAERPPDAWTPAFTAGWRQSPTACAANVRWWHPGLSTGPSCIGVGLGVCMCVCVCVWKMKP